MLVIVPVLAWNIHEARKQRIAVAALEEAGCDVEYRVNGALSFRELLRMLIGEEQARTVCVVSCRKAHFCDADLAHLEGLTDVNGVFLDETKVTDAGLVHLKCLAQLGALYLSDTQVTDAGLLNLGGLIQLHILELGGTQVTDAGVAYLRPLTNLRVLGLGGTHVTDGGLINLQGLTRLESLWLGGTSVTDAGLTQLRGLSQLRRLVLNGTQVTYVGVQEFSQALPNCTIGSDAVIVHHSETRSPGAEHFSDLGDPAPLPGTTGTPGEVGVNSIGMNLTLIPAGEFLMGSPQDEPGAPGHQSNEAQHRVRITRPFYMGTYEVTLGQFLAFYHDADYKTRWKSQGISGSGLNPKNGKFEPAEGEQYVPWDWGHPSQTIEHPAVNVSWNDALAFCEWLSGKEGRRYRLPTEAEWEYACRAGSTSRFYNGDDLEGLAEVDNVADACFREQYYGQSFRQPGIGYIEVRDGYPFTAPVGKKKPNAFGLYDMHGNVWEWCAELYDENYYLHCPIDDPQGPVAGSSRTSRGGSWNVYPAACRSAFRGWAAPASRSCIAGFRVVCER